MKLKTIQKQKILKRQESFFIDYALEHALEQTRVKRESIKLVQKKNLVRKHKGTMFPHEVLGENGR